jgi:hypothetical protein
MAASSENRGIFQRLAANDAFRWPEGSFHRPNALHAQQPAVRQFQSGVFTYS